MKSNKKEEKNKEDCLIFMNYIKQELINNGAENVNIETNLNHCLFTDCRGSFKINGDDYIITGSHKYLEPRTYRKYFNKVLKQVKIKQFNFHSLRHTFATNCISLGVDYKTVSELLGHANVNITLNLYVHPRLSQKKKCIDMICKVFQESI